jgi:hypothetical protein
MYTDGGLGRGEPKARGSGNEAAEGVQELPAVAAAVLAEQNWWKLLDFALLSAALSPSTSRSKRWRCSSG